VTDVGAVLGALDRVRDPELDTSIVELGFVASCWLSSDGVAHVRLRLPTYFCAPNFAYLIVADAHEAVTAVDGVVGVDLALEDHFASSEINAGVSARAGFIATFPGEASNELDDLRRRFVRKAVLANQDRVVRPLLRGGVAPGELSAMVLGDVPPSDDLERLRARRRELGLPAGDGDPLLLDDRGGGIAPTEVRLHLRRARTVRVGIDANADYCRQLLTERYPHAAEPHRPTVGATTDEGDGGAGSGVRGVAVGAVADQRGVVEVDGEAVVALHPLRGGREEAVGDVHDLPAAAAQEVDVGLTAQVVEGRPVP
jgi:metal-sulfur cluster biosynthetic enzyme